MAFRRLNTRENNIYAQAAFPSSSFSSSSSLVGVAILVVYTVDARFHGCCLLFSSFFFFPSVFLATFFFFSPPPLPVLLFGVACGGVKGHVVEKFLLPFDASNRNPN